MASELNIRISAKLTGLGVPIEFLKRFTHGQTPTAYTHAYVTQTTTNIAQVLALGDVTTVDLIAIKCVSNDLAVDTSYSSSFNEEITVKEGEPAVFAPAGIVWIKNNVEGEVSVFEVLIVGRT